MAQGEKTDHEPLACISQAYLGVIWILYRLQKFM
jgi:hypothetical protein